MLPVLKSFCKDERGAVTIDWVVLTAAIVALAIAVWNSIDDNTIALGDRAAAEIATQ
jgi:Flp pilus assembly pilin Flp